MGARPRGEPGRASPKRTRRVAHDATGALPRAARLALAALLAVAPAAARAQQPSPAPLRGIVLTTDAVPVAGASVTLVPAGGAARTVVTADDGRFAFVAPEAGPAELRVRRIGFRAESLSVTLPRADTASIGVRLVFVPQTLAAVVVRGQAVDRRPPQIVDFYRRRGRGNGRFLTRAEIERRNAMRTTDLLRSIPGVRISPGNTGALSVTYRGTTCPVQVFLDGTAAGGGEFDLDAIAPSTIEGIEVYSTATLPVEFNRPFARSSCGTVLVWSRYGEPRAPRRSRSPVTSDSLARLVAQLQLYTAEQVDVPARAPEDFGRRVALPDSVRVAGATGVIAEFVVDPTGRVEPSTINVVASPHPALSDAVRAALPGAAFTAARRGGLAVRQLVQLAVQFGPGAGR